MEDNKKIVNRLDAIIVLLLYSLRGNENFPKLSEVFYQMKKIGLSNEEIASIFDKNALQIAKVAYEFKRPAKVSKGVKGK